MLAHKVWKWTLTHVQCNRASRWYVYSWDVLMIEVVWRNESCFVWALIVRDWGTFSSECQRVNRTFTLLVLTGRPYQGFPFIWHTLEWWCHIVVVLTNVTCRSVTMLIWIMIEDGDLGVDLCSSTNSGVGLCSSTKLVVDLYVPAQSYTTSREQKWILLLLLLCGDFVVAPRILKE